MLRTTLILGGLVWLAGNLHAADPDCDLLLKVKAAIAAEPSLRSLNLMISVQDGIAVIGGPVPAANLKEPLVKAVKAVPGISDARVSCWIPAREDALPGLVKAKLHPVVPVQPMGLAATSAYSPVPPPAPPAPPGPKEYPTIPSPQVPVVPSQDVAAAVEQVRRSDRRFEGLVLAVNAGTITIAGTVRDGSEVWDLAAAVRKVPGVDKVIVARTTVR